METLLIVLLVISLFGHWLWFVAFRAYRTEIKKHLRKAGREKYQAVYMAEYTARLDEAQRKGHLKHNKHTAPIYHYNEDGSTVVLNEDRIEFLHAPTMVMGGFTVNGMRSARIYCGKLWQPM